MAKDVTTLRALCSDNVAFIERLYAGSRAQKFPRSGRPTEQVAVTLSQQFNPRPSDYQVHSYEEWAFALPLETRTQMHTHLPTHSHLLSMRGTFPSRS